MPVGLVRKDYLLNEAFELIGLRLYGHDWKGQELFARKAISPTEVRQRRAPFDAVIDETKSLGEKLWDERRRTVDANRMKEIEAELAAANRRRTDAYHELEYIADPSDESYLQGYHRYERRCRSEERLIEALGRGDIEAYIPGGLNIPSEFWAGRKGFAYDLALSAVCMPRNYSGARRGSVRIRESQFDKWVRLVLPDDAADRADISPEDRCRGFLIDAARSGQKMKSREAYKEEARASIPGLSERAFLQAWAEVAPPHWRRKGRPRSR